mgnify:CR=1 FL=1
MSDTNPPKKMKEISLAKMYMKISLDVIITHIKAFVIFVPKTIAELYEALENRHRYGDITMWDFSMIYKEWKENRMKLDDDTMEEAVNLW